MGRYPGLFRRHGRAGLRGVVRPARDSPTPRRRSGSNGLLAATGLLAVNAACCTFERTGADPPGTVTLRRLLPHVMHLAFLGVVLSHMVSAIYATGSPASRYRRGGRPGGRYGVGDSDDRFDAAMAPEGTRGISPPRSRCSATGRRWRTAVRANERAALPRGVRIYVKNFGTTPWAPPRRLRREPRPRGDGDPRRIAPVHRREPSLPRPLPGDRCVAVAAANRDVIAVVGAAGPSTRGASTGDRRLSAAGFVPEIAAACSRGGVPCRGDAHRARSSNGVDPPEPARYAARGGFGTTRILPLVAGGRRPGGGS